MPVLPDNLWAGHGVIGSIASAELRLRVGPGGTPLPVRVHAAVYELGTIIVQAVNDNATEGAGGDREGVH